MSAGKNTASGEQLRGYIERVEALRAEKKELSAQETAIWAEAKAQGFAPKEDQVEDVAPETETVVAFPGRGG